MTLGDLLRPSEREVRAIVVREMDPARARSFEQLCPGPALTVLALAGIVLCAAVVTPYRIAWRLLRGGA